MRGARAIGAIGAIGALLLSCGATRAHDQAPEPPSIQKSPLVLPEKLTLPGNLFIRYWPGENQIPVATVQINDSLQEQAAISTGLNANTVQPDAATRLKLPAPQTSVRVHAFDSISVAKQTTIATLRAGTIELKQVPFAVTDVPGSISLQPHPDAPAAWLGMPFLSAFQVTFDPLSRNLLLASTNAPLPKAKFITVVPLVMQEGRPYVRVTLPGARPFLALVDTSSPGTVIPKEIAEKLKLKPKREVSVAQPDGKLARAAFVELPRLLIGKAEWKGCKVIFLTSEAGQAYSPQFAVIGMDFLRQYQVTLNFVRLQMALAPTKKADGAQTAEK